MLRLADKVWGSFCQRHPRLAELLEQEDAVQAASLYILQHPHLPAPLVFVNARWTLVKMATKLVPDSRNLSYEELLPSLASEEVVENEGDAGDEGDAENDEGVETLLSSLPPTERFVLQARYYGFRLTEIASMLNVTPRTVKRCQQRALSALGLERACSEGSEHSASHSVALR